MKLICWAALMDAPSVETLFVLKAEYCVTLARVKQTLSRVQETHLHLEICPSGPFAGTCLGWAEGCRLATHHPLPPLGSLEHLVQLLVPVPSREFSAMTPL